MQDLDLEGLWGVWGLLNGLTIKALKALKAQNPSARKWPLKAPLPPPPRLSGAGHQPPQSQYLVGPKHLQEAFS